MRVASDGADYSIANTWLQAGAGVMCWAEKATVRTTTWTVREPSVPFRAVPNTWRWSTIGLVTTTGIGSIRTPAPGTVLQTADPIRKAIMCADPVRSAGPAPRAAARAPMPGPAGKITICHATSSRTNPYVSITIAAQAVIHAHSHHTGPLFPQPGWGDVIPPFGSFAGLNWPAGRELLGNNCRPVPAQVLPPVVDPPVQVKPPDPDRQPVVTPPIVIEPVRPETSSPTSTSASGTGSTATGSGATSSSASGVTSSASGVTASGSGTTSASTASSASGTTSTGGPTQSRPTRTSSTPAPVVSTQTSTVTSTQTVTETLTVPATQTIPVTETVTTEGTWWSPVTVTYTTGDPPVTSTVTESEGIPTTEVVTRTSGSPITVGVQTTQTRTQTSTATQTITVTTTPTGTVTGPSASLTSITAPPTPSSPVDPGTVQLVVTTITETVVVRVPTSHLFHKATRQPPDPCQPYGLVPGAPAGC